MSDVIVIATEEDLEALQTQVTTSITELQTNDIDPKYYEAVDRVSLREKNDDGRIVNVEGDTTCLSPVIYTCTQGTWIYIAPHSSYRATSIDRYYTNDSDYPVWLTCSTSDVTTIRMVTTSPAAIYVVYNPSGSVTRYYINNPYYDDNNNLLGYFVGGYSALSCLGATSQPASYEVITNAIDDFFTNYSEITANPMSSLRVDNNLFEVVDQTSRDQITSLSSSVTALETDVEELKNATIRYTMEFGELVGNGTVYFSRAYTDRPYFTVNTSDGSAATITLQTNSSNAYIGATISSVNDDTTSLLVFYCTVPEETG